MPAKLSFWAPRLDINFIAKGCCVMQECRRESPCEGSQEWDSVWQTEASPLKLSLANGSKEYMYLLVYSRNDLALISFSDPPLALSDILLQILVCKLIGRKVAL